MNYRNPIKQTELMHRFYKIPSFFIYTIQLLLEIKIFNKATFNTVLFIEWLIVFTYSLTMYM